MLLHYSVARIHSLKQQIATTKTESPSLQPWAALPSAESESLHWSPLCRISVCFTLVKHKYRNYGIFIFCCDTGLLVFGTDTNEVKTCSSRAHYYILAQCCLLFLFSVSLDPHDKCSKQLEEYSRSQSQSLCCKFKTKSDLQQLQSVLPPMLYLLARFHEIRPDSFCLTRLTDDRLCILSRGK